MACRRSPAGDPPTGPRHRWKPRCRTSRAGSGVPRRWRPGCRESGFPGVGDLGVGARGSLALATGCRGFHGVGDLGVGDRGSLALATWGSGVPWCWRPGGRGFPGVGDLGIGGRGFHGVGDLGVGGRGFHGVGDLGVSSLSHTALWPPHGDNITDWIATLVTLLTALSARMLFGHAQTRWPLSKHQEHVACCGSALGCSF